MVKWWRQIGCDKPADEMFDRLSICQSFRDLRQIAVQAATTILRVWGQRR
ncbi:MAG: hypothetical protein V2J11_06960 [Desulfofustis sp.]|jgi:hypothetical protein|nr:hypothetical protein [Desulfofustis sp.]